MKSFRRVNLRKCKRPSFVILLCAILWTTCYLLNLLAKSLDSFTYPPDMDLYRMYTSVKSNDFSNLPPRTMPKFETVMYDTRVCNHNPEPQLLFLVKSVHKNFAQREQIRRTWGNPGCTKSRGMISRTLFLIGQLKHVNETKEDEMLQRQLEMEQFKHLDILQFDFVDAYTNNTYKLLSALEFASSQCSAARFVVIVDDDFLVHPVNLAETLKQVPAVQYPSYVAGRVFTSALPNRFPLSKWYVSYRTYPFHVYPDYPTGGTMLLSMPMVEVLAAVMPYAAYLHIDDVLLGILLFKLGIKPVHLDDIHVFSSWVTELDPTLISAHGYKSPEKLRKGWTRLNLQSCCEGKENRK